MYLCFFGKVKIRAFKRKPPQTTHPIQNPPSCRVHVCPKLNIWMMRPLARGRTCVFSVHVFSCSVWGHKEVMDVLACLLPQVA